MNHADALSHLLNCATCMKYIVQYNAQKAGASNTEKKRAAARANGKLGGRPKKK